MDWFFNTEPKNELRIVDLQYKFDILLRSCTLCRNYIPGHPLFEGAVGKMGRMMNKLRIVLTFLEVKNSHFSVEVLLLDNHVLQHRNT